MNVADRLMLGGLHQTTVPTFFSTAFTDVFNTETDFNTTSSFATANGTFAITSRSTSVATGPYATFYETGINTVDGFPTDTRQTSRSTTGTTSFPTSYETDFSTVFLTSQTHLTAEIHSTSVNTTRTTSANTWQYTGWHG
jgi:hypothetical protein